MTLKLTIKAAIRPGEQSGYVAECLEIPVVTQRKTVTRNLREAVELHLEGEDLAELGMCERESVLAILEILAHRHLTARLRNLAKRMGAGVRAGKLHTMEEVFGKEQGRLRPSRQRGVVRAAHYSAVLNTINVPTLIPMRDEKPRRSPARRGITPHELLKTNAFPLDKKFLLTYEPL